MEIFKTSGSEKRTGNDIPHRKASVKTINDLNLKKICGVSIKANTQPKPEPQTFAKAVLGAEKRTKQFAQNDKYEKTINSYVKSESDKLKYLQKCRKFDSPEKILSGGYSENNFEIYDHKIYQNLTSFNSKRENSQELHGRRCEMKVYDDGKANPGQMIDIIQRELKILTDMSPSLILLTTAFSETLSHYKECLRCSKKISSVLPQILNRIQKLVEYITNKRLDLRLNDSAYFRLELDESIFKESEKGKNSASSEPSPDFLSKKLERQIELLEKVNAIDIAEGRLGIQIALQFKNKIKKKGFFGQRFLKNFGKSFPTVYLKESDSTPIIEIIKPNPKPQVFWDIRKVISLPKQLFYAYHQVFALPSVIPISVLVINPVVRIHRIEKTQRTLYFKSNEPCEEQILQTKKNLLTVFIHQNKKTSEPKAVRSRCSKTRHPNEKKRLEKSELLANAPEVIRELLKETEERKMQIHKMKELELEIKQLKDLIVEVHKNQVELGKVVDEEGIYSQLIMKLTDPNMLEEESQIVKKLAGVEELGKKSSIENLQATVDYIKQKCTIKNRMIMTLVRCLQSNLYKKWWEEIMNSTFDESKSTEKLNQEKVAKLLQQSSLFPLKSKKESKESLEESRSEEHNSEEQPNVKKVVEANFSKILCHQEEKSEKTKGCAPLSNFEDFLNWSSRKRILTFPITTTNFLIRKLENEISLLNMENERLWQEVHKLRDLLKDLMKRCPEERLPSTSSEEKLSDKITKSGKTINLDIQITPERDFPNLNDDPYPKTINNDETFSDSSFSEVFKNSPVVKYTVTKPVTDESETVENEKSNQDQYLSDLSEEFKFRSEFEGRRWEKDSDDFNDSFNCGQENKKSKTFQVKNFIKHQKTSKKKKSTSHSSKHNIQPDLKPFLTVPSKLTIPKGINIHQAGPSHRPANFRHLLKSHSRAKLIENQSLGIIATMANERKLQTIPEHDQANYSCTSKLPEDVSQAIQYLRTKIKFIHKNVTVLKLKNDQIDKLLDKMIDNAIDGINNLDETGND